MSDRGRERNRGEKNELERFRERKEGKERLREIERKREEQEEWKGRQVIQSNKK